MIIKSNNSVLKRKDLDGQKKIVQIYNSLIWGFTIHIRSGIANNMKETRVLRVPNPSIDVYRNREIYAYLIYNFIENKKIKVIKHDY